MCRKKLHNHWIKTVSISRVVFNFVVKMCNKIHTDSGPHKSPFLIKETQGLVRLAQGLSLCQENSASVNYSHNSFIGSLFQRIVSYVLL
jgi:hypothetical protein